MKPETFEIKGVEWEITTTDGTKKAIATCRYHPKQEATVSEGPMGVLVCCPQCPSVLEFCSKEEFEAEKTKILAPLTEDIVKGSCALVGESYVNDREAVVDFIPFG